MLGRPDGESIENRDNFFSDVDLGHFDDFIGVSMAIEVFYVGFF
jgi:hypothetical protein